MGACLSKKKTSSTSSHPLSSTKSLSTPPSDNNNVKLTLFKPETTLNNKNNNIVVQEKQQNLEEVAKEYEEPKKEIFIIKHRKSHDEREKNNIKITPFNVQHNLPSQIIDGFVSSSETESLNNSNNNNNNSNKVGVVGVRTSSCTKEEVDAILIQCGRLSRSSSGKAASSSTRKYSGSKRSFDFDHCDNNDAISAEDEQKRVNASDNSEEYEGVTRHNNRPRHRNSPNAKSSNGRRRTPSRERDQRSSSRERRVSRSPGRRSSDTNANGSNNNNNGSGSGSGCSRPGKMVTVPATVTSLVMDKSNNGESVKRVNVKRNVASPRSMSPARGIGNGVNQQQNQPSLSRNNSGRKTEVSPYRRNPLSDVDPNSLSYPQSNANNGGNKVQNKGKKEIEAETVQKPNADMKDSKRNRTSNRVAIEKGLNCHTKEQQQQEEEIKVMSDNAIVKNVVMPSGITRSRSSRRSRDFDIINSAEAPTNPPLTSYTSLLLEDIQNFHQKNTNTNTTQPSVSLPACLNKACSILEAVADLNSTTSSTFSNDKKIRNEYNNVVPESSFVESEIDVMEPSLHKYVTVKRGGSICGVIDMEDQESSGSNSFTVSSGQQQWNICSSGDSSECWSSRLNSKEDSLKRRECDHQHSGGIGRGRLATAST
ncbi:hypothetical protein TSUD_406510 [Trifolium subterraneum]|uniref:Uncharacterized protein n=1 Tax=Trifolium subterraneum TaxID=3900 RepID=A0A2Z6PGB0_TRISU|nr:hypothetical protein TSUD_406510 [Trifolium subterraneum]